MEGGGRRERAPAKRRREDPPAVDEPSPDELLPVPTDGGLAGSLDRAEEPLCRLGIIAGTPPPTHPHTVPAPPPRRRGRSARWVHVAG